MTMRIAKAAMAVAVAVCVGAVFLGWYPFPFSLAWPGLVLARLGVPHSWFFAVGTLAILLTWCGLRSRTKPWWQVIAVSLLVSAGYCGIAFSYLLRLSVPLPAVTPYDSTPAQRAAYLRSYDEGYRNGLTGTFRTYCFSPEAETRGFYEGASHGSEVWYRFLGRPVPGKQQRLTEISAARDGVRVELDAGGLRSGTTNGNGPTRSMTNRPKSEAGVPR